MNLFTKRGAPILPLIWYSIFLIIPFFGIFLLSFLSRNTYGGIDWIWNLNNYFNLFDSSLFVILKRSLILAHVTAFVCVFLGIFFAWVLISLGSAARRILHLLIMIPFFCNQLVRIYSLKEAVGIDGIFQVFLKIFGINFDPFVFSSHEGLVFFGMTLIYLPFAVLPIMSAYELFEVEQLQVARILGAGYWQQMRLVLWPQFRENFVRAYVIVMIPCLGEFVIPTVLGGGRISYFGNVLTDQFLKNRDWPKGAATTVVLLIFSLGFYIFVSLISRYFQLRKKQKMVLL